MAINLIAAGFPCQDLSVAGKRAGLAGDQSGLFWELVRVLECERPRWFLLENVPGLLSSNRGRDFALVLHALGRLGYGVAWRILNAQHFGLAQRRRRLWIVGCLGRPCPPEILFESQGGKGDTSQGQKAGKDIAPCLRGRPNCSHREDTEQFIVQQAISAKWAKGSSGPAGDEHHNLIVTGTISGAEAHNGNSNPIAENYVIHENISGHSTPADHARAIRSGSSHSYQFVASTIRSRSHPNSNAPGRGGEDDFNLICETPDASGMREVAGISRQLDPPDGPRYKALGNAVPVPVVEWIGRRIMEADALTRRGEGGE